MVLPACRRYCATRRRRPERVGNIHAHDSTDYSTVMTSAVINVSPAPLTITADNQTKPYGSAFTFTGTEFTTSGLLNGDTVTNVTLTSTGAAATADVSGSPYSITVSAAAGTSLTNYSITYVNGASTVSRPTPVISLVRASSSANPSAYGQSIIFDVTIGLCAGQLRDADRNGHVLQRQPECRRLEQKSRPGRLGRQHEHHHECCSPSPPSAPDLRGIYPRASGVSGH